MSSGTLSQQEIDRLLGPNDPTRGMRDGHGGSDALPYDFRRPHRMSKERLRTLEAMYEQVVKTLEGWQAPEGNEAQITREDGEDCF